MMLILDQLNTSFICLSYDIFPTLYFLIIIAITI